MQEDEAVEVEGGEVNVKGFTIRCKGNNNQDEDVIVSDADAHVISRNCEYFRNMFAHGTREAEDRVILKPDWASSTAKQIVQLLATGKIALTVRPRSRREREFFLLTEAARQLLLNISFRATVDEGRQVDNLNLTQVESFVNLCEILTVDAQITLNRSSSTCVRSIDDEQLEGPKVEMEFQNSLGCLSLKTGKEHFILDNWQTFIGRGLTIKKRDESSSSAPVSETNPPEESDSLGQFRHFFSGLRLTKETRYHLQSYSATKSIGTMLNTMCQILHQHNAVADVRAYSKEEFSLRLPCRHIYQRALEKIADSCRSVSVRIHTGNSPGYYLGGSLLSNSPCPTIIGNLQQIQAFLSVVPEKMMQTHRSRSTGDSSTKWCSLRVCAPSSKTLDRLFKAVGACQANPNTLGVDVRSKAFFAVKSVSDMKLLLAAMIDGGGSVENGDVVPTLVILEQPKGIF